MVLDRDHNAAINILKKRVTIFGKSSQCLDPST
ncbi:hypothetical protein [Microcystis aeruginosa]